MLSVEHNNRVCLIRLERPPVNALDSALLETLAGEIARAGAVDGQAIILCGTPGRFCAGLDTGELGAATPKERTEIFARLRALLAAAAACPAPMAAAVTGHCLGIGAALAALCDYRVMEQGAYKIGMPEVNRGLPLSNRVYRVLARLTGAQCAQRLCVEGRLLDPEQARRAGLVDDLAAPGGAVDAAMTWCEHILSLPQEAMRATRAACREELRSLND
ncbi:MAG: enoyl-CoA hydratase/isomerase family protein [Gammaproteobacteria bacterium]|nr:enoyl-CoA hydratase/isomerase family protein [Gammaproteobacteria bacterium]